MKQRVYSGLRSPAVIVLVAFAARLALICYWQSYRIPSGLDHFAFGWENGRVARSIASGQGFSSPFQRPTGPTAWVMPVFPYLLAAVFKLWGVYTASSALAILTLNCVFSALTCLTVFLIGREAFSPTVAVWGAWTWAFFPNAYLREMIGIVSEVPLSTLLLSLAFLMALRLPSRRSAVSCLGFGVLWSLAGMTNIACVMLLPFILGWLHFEFGSRGVRHRAPMVAAGLAFVSIATPWLARDYLVFGKLVPWRSNFGLELRVGNSEDCWASWSPLFDPAANLYEMEKYRQMGELSYVVEKRRDALRFIASHPACFLQMTARRVLDWWLGPWRRIVLFWESGRFFIGKYFLFSVLFTVLTFLGLRLAIQKHEAWTFPFGISLVIFPLMYYLTYVVHFRPRHPIEPVMVVLSVYAVANFVSNLRRRLGPIRTESNLSF